MFALPALLGLLALGAVPIIIHLIFRQRYRRIRWAAMDFLMAAIKRTRRRLRLENLLLLILRILAIALLVLAAAVPTFAGKQSGIGRGGAKHTVIVLDTSASMGYLADGAGAISCHTTAMTKMREIIANLQDGDSLSILAASDRALSISGGQPLSSDVFTNPVALERVLSDSKLALSYRPSSILPALKEALVIVNASAKVHREVIVFTDMQKSAWGDDAALDQARGELAQAIRELTTATGDDLTFLPVGPPDWSNLIVESLAVTSNVVAVDVPITVTATLWNPSARSQPTTGVELQVGGPEGVELSPKSTRQTSMIEPGQRAAVSFTLVLGQPGTYRIAARIFGDNLVFDDYRALALEVTDKIEVLLISGQTNQTLTWFPDELGFIHVILESRPGEGAFRVTHLDEAAAYDLEQLSRYRVIVLGNVMSLAPAMVERLSTWLRDGGGLLVFSGEQTLSGESGSAFYDQEIFPARIVSYQTPADSDLGTPELIVSASAQDHPLLRQLIDAPSLFRAFVPRHVGLEIPAGRTDAHTLIDLTASSSTGRPAYPFLVEGVLGAGKSLMVATSADEEWSDLMQYPIYPVLVTEMVGYLASRPRPSANVLVGGEIQAAYPQHLIGEATLTVPQPALPGDFDGRSTIPARIVPDESATTLRARFIQSSTERPGFYVLNVPPRGDGDAGLVDSFAVNVAAAEGDLTRIETDEVRAIAPDANFNITEDLSEVVPNEGVQSEFPGWRIFLWALLIVLALETFLAQRFGDFGGKRRA